MFNELGQKKKHYIFSGLFFIFVFLTLAFTGYEIPYYPKIVKSVLAFPLSLVLTIFFHHLTKYYFGNLPEGVFELRNENLNANLEVSLKVLMLILLTTPAQSISLSMGITDSYFPTDKIAPLIGALILFYKNTGRALDLIKKFRNFFILTLTLTFIILTRDFYRKSFIIADYNLLFSLFAIINYLVVFNSGRRTTVKALKYALSFQLILGGGQLFLFFFGPKGSNMFFHNHPSQVGYDFLYRVSGGFLESSQFSSFLALSIIVLLREGYKKNLHLIIPSFLLFTISYSITGYVILCVYVLFNVRRGYLFILGICIALPIIYQSGHEGKQYVIELFRKVYSTLDISPQNFAYPRFSLMFKKLNDLFDNNFNVLFGSSLSKVMPGGDLISYYTHSLGTIGSTIYYILLSFLLTPITPSLIIVFAFLNVTNAPLTSTITQIFIVLSTFFSGEFLRQEK